MQIMDADRATAHLAPDDDLVTFIEMRGNSRVSGGGGALDAMSARDIDLDYTDDGTQLERVALNGSSGLTMTGTGGAAGKQLTGEALEVKLGPDGAVTSATGRENVQMVLPAAGDAPARTIKGKTLEAYGAAGAGLTEAHFVDAVEYHEEATRAAGGRTVHSERLDLSLSSDSVTGATFDGAVAFEEPAFRAQSSNARYDPVAGTLHLAGSDRRGQPCVADDRIAVDAQTIDVTVESRRLKAAGTVKTQLRPEGATERASSPCAIALRSAARKPAADATANDSKLPGLLKSDQIVNATAETLEYGGTGQSLLFTGNATLFQGRDTAMRGDRISIDQESGNLVASGGARFEQAASESADDVSARAEEISYTDSSRRIEYRSTPAGGAKTPNGTVRVNGPQGNLEASRIEVFLQKESGRAERLEAYEHVTARIDTKTATADHLTYVASADRYELTGGAAPAKIVYECTTQIGKTLTYSKADGSIFADGKDELRARTSNAGCQQASPASR
jgi:lipopolysaccharide export system protein LptA